MNPMKFETVAAPGGYRVHYKDKRNGKIILWSEVYSDLPGAKRAIFLTKLHARAAVVAELWRLVLRRAS
jgi:uncharacterized protein YegP (UPF0339 family)